MTYQALFAGLVYDEYDNPVEVTRVGNESTYVVNDAGFLRHIPSEYVDRQVLNAIHEMIAGHENIISEQAAKFLGQEDIFTKAMIETQLENIDEQFDTLLRLGLPEETRLYLGMIGFRIRIDIHGDVIEIVQPGMINPEEE